jgi:hypothetical protein
MIAPGYSGSVEFGRHGGEEGVQQDQVMALDIPAGLFDLRP